MDDKVVISVEKTCVVSGDYPDMCMECTMHKILQLVGSEGICSLRKLLEMAISEG